ncbi:MAG: dihydrolipoyllysine-residue acetyltransferase [Nitrospiraceae bacterium]
MEALKEVRVPDVGDFKDVNIIEVMVAPGDSVNAEDSLITLESDKATMEIPSPFGGVVKEMCCKVGDKVSEGSPILLLEVSDSAAAQAPLQAPSDVVTAAEPATPPSMPPPPPVTTPSLPPAVSASSALAEIDEAAFAKAHASPSVRRFARELGVDLGKVLGSGPEGRILKGDVQGFVKRELSRPWAEAEVPAPSVGQGIPEMAAVDFSKFGPIETRPLSRIKKLSGANLHRNWLVVPHVTQFDEADITDLEAFRKELGEEAKRQGVKVTLLAFLMKAAVGALKTYPEFNSSLDADRERLIVKKYYHLGVAVDTPDGLVVPVIRDVDRKGLFELAKELGEVSAKARDQKLEPNDMQGGCFTISSLGGIGGTALTPIVNAPEVAILGVSRSKMQPVYRDGAFVPRLILPLSLSYDHRVIDGAAAARFTSHLSLLLSDLRRLLL